MEPTAPQSLPDMLNSVNRLATVPNDEILLDVLWSDPQNKDGVIPSPRGTGHMFGPNTTKAFLEKAGLRFIIRSHVPKPNGYEIQHNGMLATVFSSPNYEGENNMGAFVVIKAPRYSPDFVSFS